MAGNVSLQSGFSSPAPQKASARPVQSLDNAWTKDPNVVYALDTEGNRLFPYTIAPGMNDALKVDLMNMINRACLSPTGRDTLQQASEMGHSFRLYCENDNRGGFYNPYNREICMNTLGAHPDFICSALVHEARHSIQFDQVPEFMQRFRDFANLDFKSYTIVNRAVEADAVAVQSKFNAEMAMAGDTGPYEAMRFHQSANVSEFMMQAARQGRLDDPATLKEGANKWYESTGLIDFYDNYYASVEKGRIQNMGKQNTLTDEDLNVLTSSLFKVRDRQYAGDSGDYLKTPQKTMLTEKAYHDVKQANALCGKTDNSVDSMPVFNNLTGKAMEITHAERIQMNPTDYWEMKGLKMPPPPPPRVDANGNVMPPPPPRTAQQAQPFRMKPMTAEEIKASGAPPPPPAHMSLHARLMAVQKQQQTQLSAAQILQMRKSNVH